MSALDALIKELKKVSSLSPEKTEHNADDFRYLSTISHIEERVQNGERTVGRECAPLTGYYALENIIDDLAAAIGEAEKMPPSDLSVSYANELKDNVVKKSLLKYANKMRDCMADLATDEYAPAWAKGYKKAIIDYGHDINRVKNADVLENDDAVASCVEDPDLNYCGMALNLDTCEIRAGNPHTVHEDYYKNDEADGDWHHLWATGHGTGKHQLFSSSRKWWRKELKRDEAIKIMVKVAECLCKHNKTGQELYYGGEIKKQFSRPSEVCLVDEKVARMLTRRADKADKEDEIADEMMAKLEDELAKTEAEYKLVKGIVDEWKDELVGEKQ